MNNASQHFYSFIPSSTYLNIIYKFLDKWSLLNKPLRICIVLVLHLEVETSGLQLSLSLVLFLDAMGYFQFDLFSLVPIHSLCLQHGAAEAISALHRYIYVVEVLLSFSGTEVVTYNNNFAVSCKILCNIFLPVKRALDDIFCKVLWFYLRLLTSNDFKLQTITHI